LAVGIGVGFELGRLERGVEGRQTTLRNPFLRKVLNPYA
jgi:hypothetical protein